MCWDWQRLPSSSLIYLAKLRVPSKRMKLEGKNGKIAKYVP